MRTTLEARVVIVGAGPVGLTLAGELGLRGVDVVVLERREVPSTESRASTLHARTMELLALRGLLDEFGELPHEPLGHFGGIPLDLNLPSPYAGQWKVPQTRTTAILRSWAIDLGAVVLEGHSLSKVTTTSSGIVVRVDSRHGSRNLLASYLVGCDGETSTTARLMNTEFAGRSSDRQLHRVDVTGIDIRNRKFERLTSGLAIAARREDVTRVMVHEFGSNPADGRSDSTFDDIARIWKRVTGEDIRSAKPQWVNSFGNASQQAKKYRSGRLFLAGDAAHRQMPVGGQALNLGMQDAFNLGWKLAMAVCGSGDERLLDSYHDERHAVARNRTPAFDLHCTPRDRISTTAAGRDNQRIGYRLSPRAQSWAVHSVRIASAPRRRCLRSESCGRSAPGPRRCHRLSTRLFSSMVADHPTGRLRRV